MISVAEALATISGRAKALPPVETTLSRLPLGAVLAAPIVSDLDSPPYTKSMMDGYAVRAADIAGVTATLRVIEEVAAGQIPTKFVQAGEATRIMTGAPIPNGADAVVMIERTEPVGPNEVRLLAPAMSGQNIMARGTEMKAGEVVLKRGSILAPQDFGLLASVGRTSVSVHPMPSVAILSTGDEIVEPPDRPGPGQIRNSNGSMLRAQVVRAGGDPQYLGIARDDAIPLRKEIERGLNEAEVLILSGGVSAGAFDLVPGVLQELGVESHFHKVALKPGKPIFFGTRGNKLVFGLPGNPVSSFVCFELFIRTALQLLQGQTEPGPRITRLPIVAEFTTDNDRPTFWPARTEIGRDIGVFQVRALPWQGSADLRALHGADALLAIPPGQQHYAANEPVPVILLK
jgi:molybdopterin molybdotransferase